MLLPSCSQLSLLVCAASACVYVCVCVGVRLRVCECVSALCMGQIGNPQAGQGLVFLFVRASCPAWRLLDVACLRVP